MDPAPLFLLLAPIGVATIVANLLVLSVALIDAYEAAPRICTNNRIFHNVLTANQALASLLLGAAHVVATLRLSAPLVDTVVEGLTIGAALSIALIAADRFACVAQRSLQPTLASTQRRRAGAAVGASWLAAAAVVMAPIPPVWRPIVVALTQFAVPAFSLLAAQLSVALRLRKRKLVKTNALLTVSVVHFVAGFALPTAACGIPSLTSLTHTLCVLNAALSPFVYGWLSKPIRKRIRRLVNAPCVHFGKRRKEERRLRMMAGADKRMHVYIVAVPLGIYV